MARVGYIFFFLISHVWFMSIVAQCDPYLSEPLSPRIANYNISVNLDHESKKFSGTQAIVWKNTSPDTIEFVRLYMYINAFKDLNSTFLGGMDGNVFGTNLNDWPEEHFGWINIDRIVDESGMDLTNRQQYVQPDDGNKKDESVIQIDLYNVILPGDTLRLNMNYTARLPRIIVRTGWAPNNYFAFLHWFPQMGVYEQDTSGVWGWNCHQFFRGTEFYADFGNYDVEINLDNMFKVASSGCIINQQMDGNRQRVKIHAEDIIDFAWIAYPDFEEFYDEWNDVSIRTLISPAHAHLTPRFSGAVKQVLEYMSNTVGSYPYPMITIVDPPIQGLNSGFMEYPTLITVGSFHVFPKQIRSIESLAMHEFLHQYFMGMVATNEKEEAWLDEGFVTYFEDRILDDLYGSDRAYMDLLGYRTGNAEFSRQEYVTLDDPNEFRVSIPGWQITNARKGIIYGKTSLVLKTLENMIGRTTMDEIMRTYFQEYKFKHPRGADFIGVVNRIVKDRHGKTFGEDLNWFFDQTIYQATSCDFKVVEIDERKNEFTVRREGELALPTEIKVLFEDGSSDFVSWPKDKVELVSGYPIQKVIIGVHIDPDNRIPLDLNMVNNSLSVTRNKWLTRKYFSKILFWVQNTLQTISMLL